MATSPSTTTPQNLAIMTKSFGVVLNCYHRSLFPPPRPRPGKRLRLALRSPRLHFECQCTSARERCYQAPVLAILHQRGPILPCQLASYHLTVHKGEELVPGCSRARWMLSERARGIGVIGVHLYPLIRWSEARSRRVRHEYRRGVSVPTADRSFFGSLGALRCDLFRAFWHAASRPFRCLPSTGIHSHPESLRDHCCAR